MATQNHLILTNDDGIEAEGLQALTAAVKALGGPNFLVVAPAGPRSECSHAVTTREALRVEKRGESVYAVQGSPADCVRIAMTELMPPGVSSGDVWVLSGINHGGNLGVDIHYSGTVAAAREAALLGARAAAFSQYRRKDLELDWNAATAWVARILADLRERALPAGALWNVNLPHLESTSAMPEVAECEPGRRPMPVRFERDEAGLRYAGVYAEREREPGSDIELCFGGKITVSLLRT